MRNNGLAKITDKTEYPYNGTGIYLKGKTISYESCSWKRRVAFAKFNFIKIKMEFRRTYRSQAKYYCKKGMENIFRMWMERLENTTNEINVLLKETRQLLQDNN